MKKLFYALTTTALLTVAILSCQKDKEVTGVQLSITELTLILGDSATLSAVILPKDAENQAVSWKSDNSTSVTVDNNGKAIAKKIGTAIITVTTADGNKTANCTITVVLPFDEPEMVFVEGGTFMYGFTDEEWKEFGGEELDEELKELYNYPQVQETVESFYIAKYPVTQKLWKQVMGTTIEHSYPYGEGDNYPVYFVSCLEIAEFIRKLNLATGKDYHTPSSEEWEYAARGGNKSKGYKYSGSNNIDDVAWYAGNSNGSTHQVGEKLPNELGIYDMTGNVWEWICGYGWGPSTHKTADHEGLRGGSWYRGSCSIPIPDTRLIYDRTSDIGFRLVLPVSEP